MKTRILIFVVFLLVLSGCSSQNKYFPINKGDVISFDVQVFEPPLSYTMIKWLYLDGIGKKVDTIRRVSNVRMDNETQGTLTFKVGDKNDFFCMNGSSVDIEIVEDTLGLYSLADKVMWENDAPNEFNEVILYSSNSILNSSDPSGISTISYGCSDKPLYFQKEGFEKAISFKKDLPIDWILNDGIDINVPGYEGRRLMHFQRQVLPGENNNYINQGFTEDTWYAPGVGLVRLEQWINGEMSMLWTRK
jgi:hypothetical protein